VIPPLALARYEKWKEQILSTEFGRQQWEHYASSKDFLLTIVVSDDRKFGAGTVTSNGTRMASSSPLRFTRSKSRQGIS
jgi:hypothetical protein